MNTGEGGPDFRHRTSFGSVNRVLNVKLSLVI